MDHPLILIRHAESVPNPDLTAGLWALSDAGKQQAIALAHTLYDYNLSHIVSSKEPKAIATARLAAKQLNISTEVADGLHEHDRSNSPYFKTQAEFESVVINMLQHPDELTYGTETATQAQQRFVSAVEHLSQQYLNEPLAITSHGTVMTLFVAAFNDIDPIGFWKELEFVSCFVLSRPDFKLLKKIHPTKIGG